MTEEKYLPILGLLLDVFVSIPVLYYTTCLLLLLLAFVYNSLDFHIVSDLLRGFRGDPVRLTFHRDSHVYHHVAAKCKSLHGRYLPTPWLSSPHLQTALLNVFGNPPAFRYTRELFRVADGGTIALDWLSSSDGCFSGTGQGISKDDTSTILVVVPGLTSDSSACYVKQLVYWTAKQGWNTVVVNHRGLGGISLTSDCVYNAGWTEDIRFVINHLHGTYPEATLFLVGTSIGANIVVKYLGEDGENTPVAGAASICSPWDLLICDRFMNRNLVQNLYNRVLAVGLKSYAQLHEPVISRIANWEGITKSRSVRDFDDHATRIVANYETVDTYYRRCSSVGFISNVSVPLLCISSLDDPVCTKEAIPWDECRANKNIVLATTVHGGHLGFFQGIKASNLWWVGAVDEFLSFLQSGPCMHTIKKVPTTTLHSSPESLIDKAPYVNVMEDGLLVAVGNDGQNLNNHGSSSKRQASEDRRMEDSIDEGIENMHHQEKIGASDQPTILSIPSIHELVAPVKNTLAKISKRSSISLWLLAYIAIVTTWPWLGSATLVVLKRRLKNVSMKSREHK